MLEPLLLTAPPVLTVRGCEVMAELYAHRRPFDDFCSTVALHQGKYDNTDGYADFSCSSGKWPVIPQMLRMMYPKTAGTVPVRNVGHDRFRLDDLGRARNVDLQPVRNGDGLDLVKLMTGYGVRKAAAQEVAQVLNVPDVQELPVKPASKSLLNAI